MTLGDEIYKRSKMIHLMKVVSKKHFFNWSIYLSAITSILFVISVWNDKTSQEHFTLFMKQNSMVFFSAGIGAIAMILAAIAIIIVIYNKKNLHLIVTSDKKTFEGFIFPYRWGASLWALLTVISIMINIIPYKITGDLKILLYTGWLWLVLYCINFTVYLIGEVVQHVLLSATFEKGDNNN
ncbi:hypothetical protein ACVQ8P_03730 [Dellaglioa sp. BT-FLS60]